MERDGREYFPPPFTPIHFKTSLFCPVVKRGRGGLHLPNDYKGHSTPVVAPPKNEEEE